MGGFLRFEFGGGGPGAHGGAYIRRGLYTQGLTYAGAYIRRVLFSEFYGITNGFLFKITIDE